MDDEQWRHRLERLASKPKAKKLHAKMIKAVKAYQDYFEQHGAEAKLQVTIGDD
jgi:glucuronate isomerase